MWKCVLPAPHGMGLSLRNAPVWKSILQVADSSSSKMAKCSEVSSQTWLPGITYKLEEPVSSQPQLPPLLLPQKNNEQLNLRPPVERPKGGAEGAGWAWELQELALI